jgi:hypothetical protein
VRPARQKRRPRRRRPRESAPVPTRESCALAVAQRPRFLAARLRPGGRRGAANAGMEVAPGGGTEALTTHVRERPENDGGARHKHSHHCLLCSGENGNGCHDSSCARVFVARAFVARPFRGGPPARESRDIMRRRRAR